MRLGSAWGFRQQEPVARVQASLLSTRLLKKLVQLQQQGVKHLVKLLPFCMLLVYTNMHWRDTMFYHCWLPCCSRYSSLQRSACGDGDVAGAFKSFRLKRLKEIRYSIYTYHIHVCGTVELAYLLRQCLWRQLRGALNRGWHLDRGKGTMDHAIELLGPSKTISGDRVDLEAFRYLHSESQLSLAKRHLF